MKNEQLIKKLEKIEEVLKETDWKWTKWIYLELLSIAVFIISVILLFFCMIVSDTTDISHETLKDLFIVDIFILLLPSIVIMLFCFATTERYRNRVNALKKAKWILINWVDNNILKKEFFQQTYVEFDDDSDRAITILKNEYGVEM